MSASPWRADGFARDMLHMAVQYPARAARAYLPERADDGHTALGWAAEHRALMTAPMPSAHGDFRMGFSFIKKDLILDADRGWPIHIDLDGEEPNDVDTAVAAALGEHGFDPDALPRRTPYEEELPTHARFDMAGAADGLDGFADMYAWSAAALHLVRAAEGGRSVRFWPHHIDVATLIAIDETGAEEDRSVGVGVAPGEGDAPVPYVYVTPWPYPRAGDLPDAPAPFAWHVEGYTALTAPYADFAEMTSERFAENLAPAVKACRAVLGAV